MLFSQFVYHLKHADLYSKATYIMYLTSSMENMGKVHTNTHTHYISVLALLTLYHTCQLYIHH